MRFRQRFTVTGRNRKAATVLFEDASKIAMLSAGGSSGGRRRRCRRTCSARSRPSNAGIEADQVDVPDAQRFLGQWHSARSMGTAR